MASSTLDPENFPPRRKTLKGHGTKSLGPGDSSDSGSDMAGSGLAEDGAERSERDADRVVTEGEAGLGGGLDQAEEARLGTTDEEIERSKRRRSST